MPIMAIYTLGKRNLDAIIGNLYARIRTVACFYFRNISVFVSFTCIQKAVVAESAILLPFMVNSLSWPLRSWVQGCNK